MPNRPISRRILLSDGAVTLAGAALLSNVAAAQARDDPASPAEAAVRTYYKLWETKDWRPFDTLLADDFTFTSANDDDHINKAAFKTQCWDTQIDFIRGFDVEALMAKDGLVFVKYLCHTRNDHAFRNVEYHRVRDGRIASIECYFGAKSSFASAVADG